LLLKHGPIKLSQEISRSQLTILMEVLYGIDVLLILNIEAWDWVAVYMTYEKLCAIESEIYHFAGRIPNYGKFKDEITLKFTSKSKEKKSLWSCFIVSTKQRFSWASRS
jgi:hypothetical protein